LEAAVVSFVPQTTPEENVISLFTKLGIVGFEVFVEVIMKIAIFWNVALYRSCENWHFAGTCHLHLQDRKNCEGRKALAVG
jgi:hypothetical protein